MCPLFPGPAHSGSSLALRNQETTDVKNYLIETCPRASSVVKIEVCKCSVQQHMFWNWVKLKLLHYHNGVTTIAIVSQWYFNYSANTIELDIITSIVTLNFKLCVEFDTFRCKWFHGSCLIPIMFVVLIRGWTPAGPCLLVVCMACLMQVDITWLLDISCLEMQLNISVNE